MSDLGNLFVRNSRNAPPTAAAKLKLRKLFEWVSGPGRLYNLGNILGLASGISVAVMTYSIGGQVDTPSAFQAAGRFLFGDISATALTLAMLIFFYSGLQYDRAWVNGAPPDPGHNRSGDTWSGIGALLLGAGLLIRNEPIMAATAGLLHAIGKFGSAWGGKQRRLTLIPGAPDLWRALVVLSRLPALLAATLATVAALAAPDTGQMLTLMPPATLLVCYAVWLWADLKLFSS